MDTFEDDSALHLFLRRAHTRLLAGRWFESLGGIEVAFVLRGWELAAVGGGLPSKYGGLFRREWDGPHVEDVAGE